MLDAWHYHHPDKTDHRFNECKKIVSRLIGRKSELNSEQEFLNQDFGKVSFNRLDIESALVPILEMRLGELQKSLQADSPLSAIFMCGSILEGILLGIARSAPQKWNQSTASPKDKEGKVRQLHDWSLANLIDVACEIRILNLDVQKFSHALRDFRNYIHPYAQMSSKFSPDPQTARICFQVLKAAVATLSKK